MKSFTRSIEAIIILFFLIPLTGSDCEGESNIGYHSVLIPGYEIEDYADMLNDKNPETRYNAICNLTLLTYPGYLNEDSMIGKPEYFRDLDIYKKIYPMMDSGNPWISSAAIRHIGIYDYNRKKYLNNILQNDNPSLNVQLAIWYNHKTGEEDDSLADPVLLVKKANFCFEHPSWLIRQCGYQYINKKTAHQFEEKIKKEYIETSEDYIKRQIIGVLGKHLCDSSFDFLAKQYTATKDKSLRKLIVSTFPEALNRQHALSWFNNHPKEIETFLESKFMFWEDENDFYLDLLLLGLNKGWDPARLKTSDISSDPDISKDFFPQLLSAYFEFIHNYETYDTLNVKQIEVLKQLGKKIASTPSINKQWKDYEKEHLSYLLPKQFIDEQMQITSKYNKALSSLYKRHQLDSSLYKHNLKDLDYLKKDLLKMRVGKKIKQ